MFSVVGNQDWRDPFSGVGRGGRGAAADLRAGPPARGGAMRQQPMFQKVTKTTTHLITVCLKHVFSLFVSSELLKCEAGAPKAPVLPGSVAGLRVRGVGSCGQLGPAREDCEKTTPPDKKTLGSISLKSSRSGAGEQFLLLDCGAAAPMKGGFFQTPVLRFYPETQN